MKLFECMIDASLPQEYAMFKSQYGFQPGSSTIGALFTFRTLMETYTEKGRAFHKVFLDLQRFLIVYLVSVSVWWALRSKGTPEAHSRIIRNIRH